MFLASFLSRSQQFQKKTFWVDCIEHRIKTLTIKMADNKGPITLLKGLARTLTKHFGDASKNTVQKLSTTVCSEYKYYMHRLGVSTKLAHEIILEVARKNKNSAAQ